MDRAINDIHQSKHDHHAVDNNHEFIPIVPDSVEQHHTESNGRSDTRRSGCLCACATGRSDHDAVVREHGTGTTVDMSEDVNENLEFANSDTSSEYGGDPTHQDEGAEDHLIEVGDFGFIPVGLIQRALAKHDKCTCHHGVLPGDDDYPFTTFNSPTSSGVLSPSDSRSIIVETSSGNQSMTSSQVLSISSRGSSLLEQLGGGFDFAQVHIFRPLALTPEMPPFTYPIDINLCGTEFNEYDMW